MNHFALKNGQLFVLVEAAGGVYSAAALAGVCEIADAHSAFLKITEDQRVGFMVAEEALPAVAEQLHAHGLFLRPYQRAGAPSPKTCLGELCPHAEQDALGDALELSAHLAALDAARTPDDGDGQGTTRPLVTMGMNGCARACVGSGLDDVHIVGDSSGYKVSLGGKTRELPQLGQFLCDNVPKEKLPEVIATVLDIFYRNAAEDERLVDVVERMGLSEFGDAIDTLLHGGPHLDMDDVSTADESDENGQTEEAMDLPATGDDMDTLDALDANAILADGDDESFEDIPLDQVDGEEGFAVSSREESMDDVDVAGELEEESDLLNDVGEDAAEDLAENVAEAPAEQGDDEDAFRNDDAEPVDASASADGTEDADGHSDEEKELLLEEDSLDLEDASAEDLQRVTSAIRAEVEDEGEGVGTQDSLDTPLDNNLAASDMNSEVLAFEARRTEAPVARAQPAAPSGATQGSGGVSVRFEGGALALTLGDGTTLRCPLPSQAQGFSFELHTAAGLVRVTKEAAHVNLTIGDCQVRLPLPANFPRAA